jgi:type IV pilus assembly protein PilB
MHEAVSTTIRQTRERDYDRALAKALVEREVLSLQQAKAALNEIRNGHSDKTLEAYLLEAKIIQEDELLETKATLWHVPYIDLSNYEIDPEVLEMVPASLVKQYQFFPLFKIDNTLLVAMTDPKNVKAIDKITQQTQLEVSPALSSKQALRDAIQKHYGELEKEETPLPVVTSEEIQDILEVIEAEHTEEDTDQSAADLERLAEEAPVVKMANMVLTQGIMEGASDIHINPEEKMVRVRFRVDGVLRDSLKLPKNTQEALVSRIKILSNLDIAEHRIPQDGQLQVKLKDGRRIEIRVSTLPSAFGENVVMRILDKSAALLEIDNLGFEDDVKKTVYELLDAAYGIILVTGPTGSGKTTSLYAALNRLNTVEKNIITLEDPIEYRLEMIRQSQVNVKAGMTFAKGLRSILRQDPDIVMVGEIRDSETGNIAIQAALTGHLVLSTLHTNDAAGAVTRLAEMDIEPFLISSAVLGIMGQRLVRRICENCKEEVKSPIEVPQSVLEGLGLGDPKSIRTYKGRGCSKCRESGYKGRMSIIEVLKITEPIRELIFKGASTDEVRNCAVAGGMRTMMMDGWIKVLKGITTIDEVMRVTNL